MLLLQFHDIDPLLFQLHALLLLALFLQLCLFLQCGDVLLLFQALCLLSAFCVTTHFLKTFFLRGFFGLYLSSALLFVLFFSQFLLLELV